MNQDPKDRPQSRRTAVVTQTSSEAQEAREAKRKLEALFGGSPQKSPPRSSQPTGKVFANARKSNGRAPTEYRMRLERLRMARSVEEIEQAGNSFLQHHQLPDETDVLYKVLQHPEEKVVREALGQLSSLVMQGRLDSIMLLQDHLRDLGKRVTEAPTLSYIQGMQAQLQAMEN